MKWFRQAWSAFRSWPLWAQIPVGAVGGLLAIGLITAPFAEDDGEEVVTEGTTLPTTTSSSSRTSTSTTVPPTTVAPTTAAPRATAPPRTSPSPTEVASGACHSSYSGACVPIASDVDCAGGSGNGPAYVSAKRFRVVGPDVYGLDGNDNDGIACES